MTVPEILAPAGGQEQLLAAVRCGADAVYLGGTDLNARRNAANFDENALAEAARYCHARGVKLYVTVNTMLLDGELPTLERAADTIAAAGADAVILQDMAAAELFMRRYPALHRVASTQTAVHNIDGVRFLEDAGFQSFVLARELSLDEMTGIIAAADIPAEAFVHGAHCMSVSGMCALSAMLGGRSGNRGLCAQPCRLEWTCGGQGDHVLSLKDMSLMEHIRALADAGVATLKIEGRMKRPEYVAAAVTACRAARDGEPYDADTLRAVFSRSGFTDGYLMGRPDGDMFGYRTREDVTGAEGVLKTLRGLYHRERQSVPLSMSFFMDETGAALSVSDGENTVRVSGPAPKRAVNRALDAESAEKNLTKTGGTQYYVNYFSAELAPGRTLPASALNAMRREAVAALDDRRGAPALIGRTDWTPPALPPHRAEAPSPLWARYASAAQMPDAEAADRVLLPVHELTPERITALGERLIAELPPLLFPAAGNGMEERLAALRDAGLSALWADNIYGIALGRRLGLTVYGGFGLNIANSRALAFYERAGVAAAAVSFELPMGAIRALGGTMPRGIAAYGRLPLMRYRNCPLRAQLGCGACGGQGSLTDRKGVSFPVECGRKRFSTLLNSVPVDIAGRDDPADFRVLWFTRESPEECAAVIARFRRDERTDAPHTGGLYYRKLL